MNLRKKELMYLRPFKTIPANTENVLLLSWTPDRYVNNRNDFSKIQITHIGNTIADNITFTLIFGKKWVFDYQIALLNIPLQLPVPIDVEDEKIEIYVTNNSNIDFDAEVVLVGLYETEKLESLRNK